jgi:hypothetical protein
MVMLQAPMPGQAVVLVLHPVNVEQFVLEESAEAERVTG